MKAQTVLSLGSVMLLSAIVQAEAPAGNFVVIDVASSRPRPYVFNKDGTYLAHFVPKGGENSVHKAIKDDLDDNSDYFKQLLSEENLTAHFGTEPIDVYMAGTGGMRTLPADQQEKTWNNVKNVFNKEINTDYAKYFKQNFVLKEARTIAGVEEEAKLGRETAVKLTGNDEAVTVEFGGASLQFSTSKESKSYLGFGSVAASAKFVDHLLSMASTPQVDEKSVASTLLDMSYSNRIWSDDLFDQAEDVKSSTARTPQGDMSFSHRIWSDDDLFDQAEYEKLTKEMVDETQEMLEKCIEKCKEDGKEVEEGRKVCLAEQKARDIATLKKETSEGGKLADYVEKVAHPCLPKNVDINEFIKGKSLKVTLNDVVPFYGTGDYATCFKAISNQLEREFAIYNPMDLPEHSEQPIVALGSIWYNQMNLKKIGIATNAVAAEAKIVVPGDKEKEMNWKVKDIVRTAQEACELDFAEVTAMKKISPHGLTELCWSTTYVATFLKERLRLEDDRDVMITTKGWVFGMAAKIAKASKLIN